MVTEDDLPKLSWWDQLDIDWEGELILLDLDDVKYPPKPPVCGTCGRALNTSGLCSICDRRPR
jgi:hypothetical protein